eukprot:11422179-Heterocapsa_arctica.AAC.1
METPPPLFAAARCQSAADCNRGLYCVDVFDGHVLADRTECARMSTCVCADSPPGEPPREGDSSGGFNESEITWNATLVDLDMGPDNGTGMSDVVIRAHQLITVVDSWIPGGPLPSHFKEKLISPGIQESVTVTRLDSQVMCGQASDCLAPE